MEGQVEHNSFKDIVCNEIYLYSIVIQDFCVLKIKHSVLLRHSQNLCDVTKLKTS